MARLPFPAQWCLNILGTGQACSESDRKLLLLLCRPQIQEALKNDMVRFQFEGREIKLDPRAGIFITMVSPCAGGCVLGAPTYLLLLIL